MDFDAIVNIVVYIRSVYNALSVHSNNCFYIVTNFINKKKRIFFSTALFCSFILCLRKENRAYKCSVIEYRYTHPQRVYFFNTLLLNRPLRLIFLEIFSNHLSQKRQQSNKILPHKEANIPSSYIPSRFSYFLPRQSCRPTQLFFPQF